MEAILFCNKAATCQRINGHEGACAQPPDYKDDEWTKRSILRVGKPDLVKWCFRKTKLKASEVMTESEREGDINRAGTHTVCEICGHEYIDHPTVEEFPDLHVICDWRVYKL